MTSTCLTLRGIAHRFPESDWQLALDRLSVTTRTLLAITGPNGSGKSTLLRIAAGVLKPEKGEVFLDDIPMASMERRTLARHIAFLPQEVTALFDYTVEEIVGMGRYPHTSGFGDWTARDREVVEWCLRETHTFTLRHRPLSHLSGGERKRALLASVLAQEPQILLLDEPTAALDIHHQIRFFSLLRKLREKGMGIAIVTHELNLAALFCDRLLLLQDGMRIAEGRPEEVLGERHLETVYGRDVLLLRHPITGGPLVIPRIPPLEDSLRGGKEA